MPRNNVTFCHSDPCPHAATVTKIPPIGPAALKKQSHLGVPTLSDIGYDASQATTPYKGGESKGLERMQRYLDRTKVYPLVRAWHLFGRG